MYDKSDLPCKRDGDHFSTGSLNSRITPYPKLTAEQERGSAFPPKGAYSLLFIDESAGQSNVLADGALGRNGIVEE